MDIRWWCEVVVVVRPQKGEVGMSRKPEVNAQLCIRTHRLADMHAGRQAGT